MPWWAWSALAVVYGAAWRAAFRWLWEDEPGQGSARLLAGESRAAKRRRQKCELAQREQRILRAERELGIAQQNVKHPGETGERYPSKP